MTTDLTTTDLTTTDLTTTDSIPAKAGTARRTLLRIFLEGIPERVADLVEEFCCENDARLLETAEGVRIEASRHGFHEITPLVTALAADLEARADRSQIADRVDALTAALRQLRG